MISLSDVKSLSLDTTIAQVTGSDLVYCYEDEALVSPYVAEYAKERHRRFLLERELQENKEDLERVLDHSSSLEKALMVYQDQSKPQPSCEDLVNEIQRLNEKIRDLEESTQERTQSPSRWSRKQEEIEVEFASLQATLREYESVMKEDKMRIEHLCEECTGLSSRMNEENEVLEKYKTGYVNMKKRLEVIEKNVEIESKTELNEWSGSYRCIIV
ncbi:hypothetical protein JH06_1770 [Blastocystis sp. subtype 4]|uniref:hypothetical protein n=1 Tax=Blastocystis sp. subtype 4 TaxID=944170 RepID=UPI000711E6B4|nr:hypothetical protein JH06_1770 [Blastocystis sp. subtype 4]KNB44235.1 hypothetical protein JH06_1770 [Blastocystis sp. subtype 4]|eukprot:XP_014527678.1 hypothetical protein JH06_1770 [Blastocystis sp. subtype 4]